jgi:transcriptional antiterminator NusG
MSPSVRRPSSATGGWQWYAVKVQKGREEAVEQALQQRAQVECLDGVVGRLLLPVEKVAEIRGGRRVERTRKLFPGYLLCELVLDDRVQALFREIPGVNDFIRSGYVPVPLSPTEAERLVAGQSQSKVEVILPAFALGDSVRVLRGTFATMEGEVAEVRADTCRVRVRLTILGRPVLLDLEASEILQLAGDA